MPIRNLAYRLSFQGEEARRGLQQFGQEGEQAFSRVDRASSRTTGVLLQFGQGVERVGRNVNQLADRFLNMQTVVGTLAGSAGLGLLVSRSLETAENVDRLSSSLQVSAERVQTLTFTFRRFRLDQEDVADALSTLADRAQDAIDGTESMVEDFRLLGIEVDQLRGKSPAELFDLMARRVAAVEDPTRRAAAVVRTFGDDLGRQLLPLLRQGEEGLERFADQARDAGAVMSDELLEASAQAAANIDTIRQTSTRAFQVGLLSGFVDEMEGLEGSLKEAAPAARDLGKWLGEAIGFVVDNRAEIAAAASAFVALRASASISSALPLPAQLKAIIPLLSAATAGLTTYGQMQRLGAEAGMEFVESQNGVTATLRQQIDELERWRDAAGQISEVFYNNLGDSPNLKQLNARLNELQAQGGAVAGIIDNLERRFGESIGTVEQANEAYSFLSEGLGNAARRSAELESMSATLANTMAIVEGASEGTSGAVADYGNTADDATTEQAEFNDRLRSLIDNAIPVEAELARMTEQVALFGRALNEAEGDADLFARRSTQAALAFGEFVGEGQDARDTTRDLGRDIDDTGDKVNRFETIVDESFRSAARSIQSELAGAFREGELGFESLIDQAANAASEIAAAFAIQGIILPGLGTAVDAGAGALGFTGGGSGAGGFSFTDIGSNIGQSVATNAVSDQLGIPSFTDLASGFFSAGSQSATQTAITTPITQGAFTADAIAGAAPTLASSSLAAPASTAVTTPVSGLNASTIAGAAPAIPAAGVAAMIGAVALPLFGAWQMGAFDNGTYPTASQGVTNRGGRFGLGDGTSLDGGDLDSIRQITQAATDTVNNLLDATGGTAGGDLMLGRMAVAGNSLAPAGFFVGSADANPLSETDTGRLPEAFGLESPEQAAMEFVRQAIRGASGVGEAVRLAVENARAESLQAFAEDIQYAAGFEEETERFEELGNRAAQQLRQIGDAAEQFGQEQLRRTEDYIDRAEELFGGGTRTVTRTVSETIADPFRYQTTRQGDQTTREFAGVRQDALDQAAQLTGMSASEIESGLVMRGVGQHRQMTSTIEGIRVLGNELVITGNFDLEVEGEGSPELVEQARENQRNRLREILGLIEPGSGLSSVEQQIETLTQRFQELQPALEATGLTAQQAMDLIQQATDQATEEIESRNTALLQLEAQGLRGQGQQALSLASGITDLLNQRAEGRISDGLFDTILEGRIDDAFNLTAEQAESLRSELEPLVGIVDGLGPILDAWGAAVEDNTRTIQGAETQLASALERRVQLREQEADSLESFLGRIADLQDDLRFGDLAGVGPLERIDRLRGEFEGLASQSLDDLTQEERRRLTEVGGQLIQLRDEVFGTTPTGDRAQVQDTLDRLDGSITTELDRLDTLIDQDEEALRELGSIDDRAADIEQATRDVEQAIRDLELAGGDAPDSVDDGRNRGDTTTISGEVEADTPYVVGPGGGLIPAESARDEIDRELSRIYDEELDREFDRAGRDFYREQIEAGRSIDEIRREIANNAAAGARALGGPIEPGGSYLTGEYGPEWVRFDRPGHVYTAEETARMMGGAGGAANRDDRAILEELQRQREQLAALQQAVLEGNADRMAIGRETVRSTQGVAKRIDETARTRSLLDGEAA